MLKNQNFEENKSKLNRLANFSRVLNFVVVKTIAILWILRSAKFSSLTLFRTGLFGAAHGWGEGKKAPSSLKSVNYILH